MSPSMGEHRGHRAGRAAICRKFDTSSVRTSTPILKAMGVVNEQLRAAARARLSTLVARVMADGEVDAVERDDLRDAFQQEILSGEDLEQALRAYLDEFKARILADGQVTPDELRRCEALVDQLRIPLRLLPPELLDLVLGKKK